MELLIYFPKEQPPLIGTKYGENPADENGETEAFGVFSADPLASRLVKTVWRNGGDGGHFANRKRVGVPINSGARGKHDHWTNA